MPNSVPKLRDGTPLDTKNFTFHDKFRRITASEKYGIALAWSFCGETAGCSIVLVKGYEIVARALGCATVAEAVAELHSDLKSRRTYWGRFRSHMVAVLTFAPTFQEAESIAGTGADAIFAPAHHGPEASDKEKDLRFRWDGDVAQHRGGHQKRAIIRPRYQLIRVKGEGDDVLEAAHLKTA